MPETEPNQIRDAIQQAIDEHEVILFMKGTPEAPACGFSARTVAALGAVQAPFAAVDVLPDPRIREQLSAISQWPTIPQLFVRGELIGGCDIVLEMYESGELAQALGVPDDGEAADQPSASGPAAPVPAASGPAAPESAASEPAGPQPSVAPGLTQPENLLR
jgi:monothiol glutaredoxin